jgi:hypothetical protein
VKLLLLSDLHLEFAPFAPDPQAVDEADVVVLAGDIDKGAKGIRWAAETFPGKPVVYVAGNHEFYGGQWDATLAEMRAEAKPLGIHFLEDDAVELGGIRFVGCTLWTDFNYFPSAGLERRKGSMQAAAMQDAERGMNDFRLIKADPLPDVQNTAGSTRGDRLTAQHTLDRHKWSLGFLGVELNGGGLPPTRTVVVVHHAPRAESVAPRYADHSLNPAFASRLPDDLLTGATLWVHGHTHASCSYQVGSTRVECNPRGYPLSGGGFENPAFNPGLLVSTSWYLDGNIAHNLVAHLNALNGGPYVREEHLEQALRTGTVKGLPEAAGSILGSLFLQCDPVIILRHAREIGVPVATLNRLYKESCLRRPSVRSLDWEAAIVFRAGKSAGHLEPP